MKYIHSTIYTTIEALELLEAAFIEAGITGLEISDPRDFDALLNKEHDYDWDYIDESVMGLKDEEPAISFYLEDGAEGQALNNAAIEACEELKRQAAAGTYGPIDLGRMAFETEILDDEDWKDKWKEYFKPAHITDRIVVKPTWEEYQAKEGELIIEIDPGAAFGTGTHPTTTGCITLMEKYLKPGMSVMDVGCGSGILAIAAGLLGAGDCLGIEIDPVAVEIGAENVALNGLSDRVSVKYGDLTKGVDYRADVIVANLMADLVKLLTGDVAKHLKPGGVYISSGILLELKDELCQFIEGCGFDIVDVYENEKDGGWCAIAAKLKA